MTFSIVEAVLQPIQLVVVVDVSDLIKFDVSVIDCLFLFLDLGLQISDPVLFVIEIISQPIDLLLSIQTSSFQLVDVIYKVLVTCIKITFDLFKQCLQSFYIDLLQINISLQCSVDSSFPESMLFTYFSSIW